MPILYSAQKTRLPPVCTCESQQSLLLIHVLQTLPPNSHCHPSWQLQTQTHLWSHIHSSFPVVANEVGLCSGLMAVLKGCPPPRHPNSVNINLYSKIHDEVKGLKEGPSPGFRRWALNPVTGRFVTETRRKLSGDTERRKPRDHAGRWELRHHKPERRTNGQQTPAAMRAWSGFSPRGSGGCKALITPSFQINDLQNGERTSVV